MTRVQEQSHLARGLVAGVRFYRRFLSPLMPPRCRYHPTCSRYAIDAVHLHGGLRGLWLAIKRVMRCHPFGGYGYDPVPPPAPDDAPGGTAHTSGLSEGHERHD